MSSKKEHISAYVEREIYDKLMKIANYEDRSISFIVVKLIEEFLKKR